jgi:hypothetical protein
MDEACQSVVENRYVKITFYLYLTERHEMKVADPQGSTV